MRRSKNGLTTRSEDDREKRSVEMDTTLKGPRN